MIYSLTGKVSLIGSNFLVVNVGGVGFKVTCSPIILARLKIGETLTFFTHFQLKEDKVELYGFLSEEELSIFSLLNLVNGVGPKSAMAIMNTARPKDILAAIKMNKSDLLVQAGGVGKKLADRIVLELKNKISEIGVPADTLGLETDVELMEVLVSLGYRKEQVRQIISNLDSSLKLEGKIKAALKILSGKKSGV